MDKDLYKTQSMRDQEIVKVILHEDYKEGQKQAYFTEGRYVKHWHQSVEICYVETQGCKVWKNGTTRELKHGDMEIINSGETHEFYDFQEPLHGCTVYISYSFIKELFPEFDTWYFMVDQTHERYQDIVHIIEVIREMYKGEDALKFLKLRSYTYDLLYVLITYFKYDKQEIKDSKSERFEERFKEILSYIKENYCQCITLSETAERFDLTPEHFSRMFKVYMGVNFIHYLKKLRMEKAKEYLVLSDLNFTNISYKIGEPDVKTFINDFKKEYTITPNQYRKLHQKA